ncbi:MAG: hypothetical protein H7145_24675, partial [Akkermansiaceae bacterium]|nr:hypothetical protein [Armatimonadota bacterium]
TRPYVLWKSVEGWSRHVAIVMRKSPRLVSPHKWEHIPWRRTVRDTDRALVQAVWGQASGKGVGTVPDDPFAAEPDMPLHRRDLPDGSMLWYSVGDNGTDDGGDESKDRVLKVLPVKTVP